MLNIVLECIGVLLLLTAEDTLEPRERLIEAAKINGIDNFKTLIPGEVIFLK